MAGKNTLPETLDNIAYVEKEAESAKASGDTKLLDLYLANLAQLRKKENLLIQQQLTGE